MLKVQRRLKMFSQINNACFRNKISQQEWLQVLDQSRRNVKILLTVPQTADKGFLRIYKFRFNR